MTRARTRGGKGRGARGLNAEIPEELLRAVSGGAPNSGTGRTYQEQNAIGSNPRTPQAQAAQKSATERLKKADEGMKNFFKGFAKGVAGMTGVPDIVNGIKHHSAGQALLGFASAAANLAGPAASMAAKAGATTARVANTAAKVVKNIDKGAQAVAQAASSRKKK